MTIEEITITEITTGQIIKTGQEADGTTTGQVIEVTIDEVMTDQITDKIIRGHLETGVRVEIELGIIVMTI